LDEVPGHFPTLAVLITDRAPVAFLKHPVMTPLGAGIEADAAPVIRMPAARTPTTPPTTNFVRNTALISLSLTLSIYLVSPNLLDGNGSFVVG
jgi:hypothetical protein